MERRGGGEGARDTSDKFKSVSRRWDFIDFNGAQRSRDGIGLIEKLENLNTLVKTNGEGREEKGGKEGGREEGRPGWKERR